LHCAVAIAVPGSDRGQETVAPARHCFHEPGIIRRIAESVTQASDGCIEAVIEIDKGIGWPQSAAQLFPSYNLSGFFQQ
jgi:hypothetical protein